MSGNIFDIINNSFIDKLPICQPIPSQESLEKAIFDGLPIHSTFVPDVTHPVEGMILYSCPTYLNAYVLVLQMKETDLKTLYIPLRFEDDTIEAPAKDILSQLALDTTIETAIWYLNEDNIIAIINYIQMVFTTLVVPYITDEARIYYYCLANLPSREVLRDVYINKATMFAMDNLPSSSSGLNNLCLDVMEDRSTSRDEIAALMENLKLTIL